MGGMRAIKHRADQLLEDKVKNGGSYTFQGSQQEVDELQAIMTREEQDGIEWMVVRKWPWERSLSR